MTWVKAKLTNEQDELVKEYQDKHDVNKDTAVAELVHKGALAELVGERVSDEVKE